MINNSKTLMYNPPLQQPEMYILEHHSAPNVNLSYRLGG